MVVMSVREYKNAEAYDHLCGLIVIIPLRCICCDVLTSRSSISYFVKEISSS